MAPAPLGEIPEIAQTRKRRTDVRAAIERRFAENHVTRPDGEEEGELTAAVADRYVEAVRDGDEKKVSFLRGVTVDLCGPQRQGIDLQAKVYSVVRIVGEDEEDDE